MAAHVQQAEPPRRQTKNQAVVLASPPVSSPHRLLLIRQRGGTCLGKAALGTDKPASIDDAARNRQAIWDGKQAERADVSVHRVRLTSKGGTRCQVVHSLLRAGCPSSLLVCSTLNRCLIASANSSDRCMKAVVIFSAAMDYVYYRGNHKYLPGRQKVSK